MNGTEETTVHFKDEILQLIEKLNLNTPKYGSLSIELIFHEESVKRIIFRTESSILHT